MRIILTCLLLTACTASPNVTFIGTPGVEVSADGRSYTVWRRDKKFEVVRHGWAKLSERDDIMATMLDVVAQVTGCRPHYISGDSGEMRGTLSACK